MVTISQLIPTLQVAIGPVVLISGVGLLIMSMTNRLGRVIDRGRSLVRELSEIPERNQGYVHAQLDILSRRAEYLRRAITLASISVLLAALLIITIFITAAFHIEDAWLVMILFVGAMGSLIFSLIAFIRDLNESLTAFKLDLGETPRKK